MYKRQAVTEVIFIPAETLETTTTLVTTIPQSEVTTEEVTTTVPFTTEPIVTTTNDEGLCVDTTLMKKYYFSENKTFDSSGIVVTYNGICLLYTSIRRKEIKTSRFMQCN